MYNFATEDETRARAALILYALYKSRDKNSPINGKETWDRVGSYIRSSVLKSTTTAEFVQQFCRLGKIASIKPGYLTDGAVKIAPGELVITDSVKDYRPEIFDDDSLLAAYEREGMLITMLVRERIQREKLEREKGGQIDMFDAELNDDEILEVEELED